MDVLRLLTLNIWNKQGGWPERLPLIRSELGKLKPDIIGLQEVLHLESAPNDDQAREIARDLGYYVAFAPAWDLGGGLKIGNAVLSRFPIAVANNFQLPGETGEETRSLLHVDIDAPCGRVPVFVTHLNWQLHHGFVRERQVMFITDKVKELAPTGDGFPPVVMGDFNAEPESDEIRFLKGWTTRLGKSVYFADCFGVAGDGSPGFTYARSNRFAAKACEPNRRIDYIFVRGPDRKLRGEPLNAKLACTTPKGDVFPTDHYGVYAEIQASPRPL